MASACRSSRGALVGNKEGYATSNALISVVASDSPMPATTYSQGRSYMVDRPRGNYERSRYRRFSDVRLKRGEAQPSAWDTQEVREGIVLDQK